MSRDATSSSTSSLGVVVDSVYRTQMLDSRAPTRLSVEKQRLL